MSLKEKLYALQWELKVWKDWTNPHFKSKYVTLDNLLTVLLPMLESQRLLLTNFVSHRELVTVIWDMDTEEKIQSEFPITQDDPQKIGSCITYAKRYNLGSIFNIITEFDDDWTLASSSGYTSTGKKVVEHRHPKTDMTIMEYVTAIWKEKDSNALRNIFTEALEVEMTESQREMLISAKDVRKKYLAENEWNPFIK